MWSIICGRLYFQCIAWIHMNSGSEGQWDLRRELKFLSHRSPPVIRMHFFTWRTGLCRPVGDGNARQCGRSVGYFSSLTGYLPRELLTVAGVGGSWGNNIEVRANERRSSAYVHVHVWRCVINRRMQQSSSAVWLSTVLWELCCSWRWERFSASADL